MYVPTFLPLFWSILLYNTKYFPDQIRPFESNITLNLQSNDTTKIHGMISHTQDKTIILLVTSQENTTIIFTENNLNFNSTNNIDQLLLHWPSKSISLHSPDYQLCSQWHRNINLLWSKECYAYKNVLIPGIRISLNETSGIPISYAIYQTNDWNTEMFRIDFNHNKDNLEKYSKENYDHNFIQNNIDDDFMMY